LHFDDFKHIIFNMSADPGLEILSKDEALHQIFTIFGQIFGPLFSTSQEHLLRQNFVIDAPKTTNFYHFLQSPTEVLK